MIVRIVYHGLQHVATVASMTLRPHDAIHTGCGHDGRATRADVRATGDVDGYPWCAWCRGVTRGRRHWRVSVHD